MIKYHLTILQAEPDQEALDGIALAGYQLFRETQTDLFYLTSIDDKPSRLPEFGGYFESLVKTQKHDLRFLKTFETQSRRDGTLGGGHVDYDLVRTAITLSEALNMRVMCAVTTDDWLDFAATANQGQLESLGISGHLPDQDETGNGALITYTPDTGFHIAANTDDIYMHNTFTHEFEASFDRPAPELGFFGQPKLDKASLKSLAEISGQSQAAILRHHGTFKRVFHKPNPPHIFDRLPQPVKKTFEILTLPFQLLLMLGVWARDEFQTKNSHLSKPAKAMKLLSVSASLIAGTLVFCLILSLIFGTLYIGAQYLWTTCSAKTDFLYQIPKTEVIFCLNEVL